MIRANKSNRFDLQCFPKLENSIVVNNYEKVNEGHVFSTDSKESSITSMKYFVSPISQHKNFRFKEYDVTNSLNRQYSVTLKDRSNFSELYTRNSDGFKINIGDTVDRNTYANVVKTSKVSQTPNKEKNLSFSSFPNYKDHSTVDLLVRNLSNKFYQQDMKKYLIELFSQCTIVIAIKINYEADGSSSALIKVPSSKAPELIYRFQNYLICNKKIVISYNHQFDFQMINQMKLQVISILNNVPLNQLPLFKFLELFMSRYKTSISISLLYKMDDIVLINNNIVGRVIKLIKPNIKSLPKMLPYCMKHFNMEVLKTGIGWAEVQVSYPNIMISIQELTFKIKRLLESHDNWLPLTSLLDCYKAEFGDIEIDENGVPLEHLITCIQDVELSVVNGIKSVIPANREFSQIKANSPNWKISEDVSNHIIGFQQDVVNILKNEPSCQILFTKFIPIYHQNFKNQLRLSNFGFTKLMELFQAIPNIVQVIGEGKDRSVTLCHRFQMKRFLKNMQRLLKLHFNKTIKLRDFPVLYNKFYGYEFSPISYGVCYIEDLISLMSDELVISTDSDGDRIISIPKRERTSTQILRTNWFKEEVLELLSFATNNSIAFEQFVPSYHHHFGRQCCISYYGFSKLIELFESIQDIVTVEINDNGERALTLTMPYKLQIVHNQIFDIVFMKFMPGIHFSLLSNKFLLFYGYTLKPENYGYNNMEDMIKNISTIETCNNENLIVPRKNEFEKRLVRNIKYLLYETPNGLMNLKHLQEMCSKYFSSSHINFVTEYYLQAFDKTSFLFNISNNSDDTVIELSPKEKFGKFLYDTLKTKSSIKLFDIFSIYKKKYNCTFNIKNLGYSKVKTLLSDLSHIVSVNDGETTKFIYLSKEFTTYKCNLGIVDDFDNDNENKVVEEEKISLTESNNIWPNYNLNLSQQNQIEEYALKFKLKEIWSDEKKLKNSQDQVLEEAWGNSYVNSRSLDISSPLNDFKYNFLE